jgi:hypothetical protein
MSTPYHSYKGGDKIVGKFVCPKGELEEWHKLGCFMGECVECGVDKLSIYLNECSTNGAWHYMEVL